MEATPHRGPGGRQLLPALGLVLLVLAASAAAGWLVRSRWEIGSPPAAAGDARQAALLERCGFVPAAPPRPAPALEVRDTAGNPVTLAGLRGKVVLVCFWGTGCPPCLVELPQLDRLADEYRDRGLAVLPVCADETNADAVRDVAGRLRLASLALCVDPRGRGLLRYDVQDLPTVCLIDRSGRLLGSGPGPQDWTSAEVRELLRACLDLPDGAHE